MGIDNIQLSPELIAALYPETLVDVYDSGETGIRPEAALTGKFQVPVYPHLGKNLRSIVFLVDYPDHEFVPENQLAFLHKILGACKCSLNDIALINASSLPVKWDELILRFHPQIIFLWGAVPAMAGQLPAFQDLTVSLMDGISIIPVLQANTMNTDNKEGLELKQRLWVCLKKLFNL